MRENLGSEKFGGDFLQRIFFNREFFREKNFFETKRFNQEKILKARKTRGPDKQPRQQRPWLVGEAKHARILELLREGRGKVWIAQQLGVGVATVQRRAAILRREGDEEGTVDFRTVRGEVCDRHGPVTVWPCVQCLAEEAKENRRSEVRSEWSDNRSEWNGYLPGMN